MHWIVNKALTREPGYEALIEQLDRQGVDYTLVRKPPFVDYLISMEDDLDEEGHNKPITIDVGNPVFVVGTTSMKEVSKNHDWNPGYIDAPHMTEVINIWGKENCLNGDEVVAILEDAVPPFEGEFFIRPDADSKSFAGTVVDKDFFSSWRKNITEIDSWTTIPKDTPIFMAPLKTIWAEYRCVVVGGKYVTGSRYKTGRKIEYSPDVGNRIKWFVSYLLEISSPMEAFVIDIADTPDGLKIIETNAISSSGFYTIDMNLFVGHIQQHFSG